MNGETSNRAKEVFSAAVERPSVERNRFLELACREDRALRLEVESLLRFHDEAAASPTISSLSIVGESEAPAYVGNCRILHRIGEGGMGEVFLAEQETPARRRVAVKLIKAGMDTREVVSRFDAERQALALMNHPNVAAVYDAGATATGRPYFVMEYIPGEPITEYCDRNRLTIQQRLELFMQVCHAVQHAHQKGVIHRDIKPSNILVIPREPGAGAVGQLERVRASCSNATVKVIDFGVARATNHQLTQQTLFTKAGQLVGTPEYMSPEQAEGSLDVDTRTDIYSLGVVLYELLTGMLPFDPMLLRARGYAEIQRIIRETDPQKPSTRLSAILSGSVASRERRRVSDDDIADRRRSDYKGLIRHIRGDLDWIVMRCLEKDRARRYETADALICEVQRHLNHEPVIAGPPSVGYRLRKLARRHRAAIGAGGAIFLALVSGLGATYAMYVRAERQRETAEKNAIEARASSERRRATDAFFGEILASVGTTGSDAKVQSVLDEALNEIESGSLAEQPEIEASVRSSIGRSYTALGLFDKAAANLQRALEIRQRSFGAAHEEVAESQLDLAIFWNHRRDGGRAESFARRALAIYESERSDATRRAWAQVVLGQALMFQNDFNSALSLFESALADAVGSERDSRDARQTARHHLAQIRSHERNHAAAIELHREILRELRLLYGEAPHAHVATTLNDLGAAQFAKGDYADSESALEDALAMRKQLWTDDHPEIEQTLGLLANALFNQSGKDDECERILRERLGVARRLYGPDNGKALHSLYTLGLVVQRHDARQAAAIYRELAGLLREKRDPRLPSALRNLGFTLYALGELPGAQAAFQEAVEIHRAQPVVDVANMRLDLTNLATITMQLGDHARAEPLFRELLELSRQVDPPDPPAIARVLAPLSECLIVQGAPAKLVQAETLLRECIAIREATLSADDWRIHNARSLLGAAICGQDRFVEAAPLLTSAAEQIAPPQDMMNFKLQAVECVVELYDAWHAAEPGQGHNERAAEWRAKLVQLNAATQPAATQPASAEAPGQP